MPRFATSNSSCLLAKPLLVIIIVTLANHVEELQAVLALRCADHAQPVAELLLLEELLRQVLQVPSAELLVRHDLNTPIAEVADGDVVAEVAGAAVDLDALLKEGREGGGVENAVAGGLGGIDDELSPYLISMALSPI